jgi:hypothetical protein
VAFGRASARAVLLEPNARAKQAQAVAEPLKKALCVPARCAKLPGRSLEPSSNGRPRGMTVTAATPYRIRLIDPASLVALIIGNDVEGFQFVTHPEQREGSLPTQYFGETKKKKSCR